jgi:hypothetical protein
LSPSLVFAPTIENSRPRLDQPEFRPLPLLSYTTTAAGCPSPHMNACATTLALRSCVRVSFSVFVVAAVCLLSCLSRSSLVSSPHRERSHWPQLTTDYFDRSVPIFASASVLFSDDLIDSLPDCILMSLARPCTRSALVVSTDHHVLSGSGPAGRILSS